MHVESSKRPHRAGRLVVLSLAILLAGCNLGGTETAPTLLVHSVTFPVHAVDLVSCQTSTIAPTISADTGAITALVWSSRDSTIAAPDSLGHIHAYAPGSTLMRVHVLLDTTKFDTLRVNVADPTGPFVTIAGVQQAATGIAADTTALHDSVDVVLHVAALGCRLKTHPKFVSADVVFTGSTTYTHTLSYPSGLGGSVYVRVNTAAVDSTTKQPVLPNGSYTLSADVKSDSGAVYTAPTAHQVTISNP